MLNMIVTCYMLCMISTVLNVVIYVCVFCSVQDVKFLAKYKMFAENVGKRMQGGRYVLEDKAKVVFR